MKEYKIIEDRRVVVEVTDEEDNLDYYLVSDYTYQKHCRAYESLQANPKKLLHDIFVKSMKFLQT